MREVCVVDLDLLMKSISERKTHRYHWYNQLSWMRFGGNSQHYVPLTLMQSIWTVDGFESLYSVARTWWNSNCQYEFNWCCTFRSMILWITPIADKIFNVKKISYSDDPFACTLHNQNGQWNAIMFFHGLKSSDSLSGLESKRLITIKNEDSRAPSPQKKRDEPMIIRLR